MRLSLRRLTRTKYLDIDAILNTKLRRCLTTFDVALLGIGHMIGSGVYVVSSMVAKNVAGPAIVLAYLLSGIASYLAALCYAELGVRFPKSGSAYCYTYLALGELLAFIVGWCLTLENLIATSAIARSCSAYIDSLANGAVHNVIDSFFGQIHVNYMTKSLDFLAFVIVIILIMVLSFGVGMTSRINNFFTIVNMFALTTVIAVGIYFADITNWINKDTGGFMPYGFSGVLSATAACFYAYVGFDIVATSSEEAKNPRKSIPIATTACMTVASVAYIGVSAVLTLMVNYKDIQDEAGLPEALAYHGASWAKVVVVVGALCAMTTALIGCIFAMTRVIYAMAEDGLMFLAFKTVNEKSKIPTRAMYSFGAVAAMLSLLLDAQTLVELLCIGSLTAYLVVSASVIILRYRPTETASANNHEVSSIGECSIKVGEHEFAGRVQQRFTFLKSCLDFRPGKLVTTCVVAMSMFMLVLCIFLRNIQDQPEEWSWWETLILAVLCFASALCFFIILIHQQSTAPLRYKVPLVPLLPSISIFINILLIVNLETTTWVPLAVWLVIGLSVYFGYGITHSKLNEAMNTSVSGTSVSTQVCEDGSLPSKKPPQQEPEKCSTRM